MEQTLQGLSPKAETLIEKENKYGAHKSSITGRSR
jgi:hypothetical protein